MVHKLKTWPEYFQAVHDEDKKFEVRKDDRGFEVGDILNLKEYNNLSGEYTGRTLDCVVRYLLRGEEFGIKNGYCAMSIDILFPNVSEPKPQN